MYTIRAEFDACEGFGNCVLNAPDLFDLDDDDRVMLLSTEVADADAAHAETAIHSCPVNALSLEVA